MKFSGIITGFVKRIQRNQSNRRLKVFLGSLGSLVFLVFLGSLCWVAPSAQAAATTPQKLVYNGHLLDSSGNAMTSEVNVRFSFWTSSDFLSTDVTSTGAIDIGASNYADWQEEFTVTPNSDGYFTVDLGTGSALLDFSSLSTSTLTSLHLQVEVKASSAADTSYEVLDKDTSSESIDRAPLLSVPFALNADLLDGRDTGTASGSIPVLQTGGLLPMSTIPGGIQQDSFILDHGDSVSSGEISLQFGQALQKKLSYDVTNNTFSFNDAVRVGGTLTATGGLTASGTIKTESGVVINAENEVKDSVLVFGHSAGQETLKFMNSEHRFEFSDDVHVDDNLSASGTLSVEGASSLQGAVTFGSTLTANGVTYTFPYSDGTASGKVLKTDGSGQLSWASDVDTGTASGSIPVLQSGGLLDTSVVPGRFVGVTTATMSGSFSAGSFVGYEAANNICAGEHSGSHMCQVYEIIRTINEDLTAFSGSSNAWIAEGAPGYTSDSNDCIGWTSNNNAHLGAWWEFSTDGGATIADGGGKGYLTNCAVEQSIACCR